MTQPNRVFVVVDRVATFKDKDGAFTTGKQLNMDRSPERGKTTIDQSIKPEPIYMDEERPRTDAMPTVAWQE